MDPFLLPGNTEEKASVSALLELAQEYFLQQLVTEPTRKEHILDLVFTSNNTMVKNVKVSQLPQISDHHLVTVLTDHGSGLPSEGKKAETEGPKIASYNFAKADVGQFKGALQSVQWAEVVGMENSSLQEKTKYFFDAVCKAAEKSGVPLKKRGKATSNQIPKSRLKLFKKTK
jgi:hypothetical protein